MWSDVVTPQGPVVLAATGSSWQGVSRWPDVMAGFGFFFGMLHIICEGPVACCLVLPRGAGARGGGSLRHASLCLLQKVPSMVRFFRCVGRGEGGLFGLEAGLTRVTPHLFFMSCSSWRDRRHLGVTSARWRNRRHLTCRRTPPHPVPLPRELLILFS